MVASRSARERKAAADAGPLAKVKIDVGADKAFVYTITCTSCVARPGRAWSTYRSGRDNTYLAVMDRWTFHLHEKHPGEQAPCLAFLPEAQTRLQQRREQTKPQTQTQRGPHGRAPRG